jgi:hypothetical protein
LTGYDYKVSGDISEGGWLLVSSYDDDTSKKIKADLEKKYSANIIDIYDNLQNSEETGKDLEKIYEKNKPDGLIFELKGCGIKECASFAIDKGLEISFLYSVVESIENGVSVEREFKKFLKDIEKRFAEKSNQIDLLH